MMMKNLIKTLWFILAVVWPSVTFAASSTDYPQWNATIDTSNIINKACIEWAWWKKCDDEIISLYACLSISSSWTMVEINEHNQWSMRFTCEASDNTRSHSFKIDCGNWTFSAGDSSSSYSAYCTYTGGNVWHTYSVQCYVDDLNMSNPTNPACIKNIKIGNVVPLNVCWDWTLDDGEECDLKWNYGDILPIHNYLDYIQNTPAWWTYANNWYSCKNCKIIKDGNFVYEPVECLRADTPISVMNNELIPYWRNLYIEDAIHDDSGSCASYDEEKTLLNEDSMKCHFAVYNGKNNQDWDPIMRFTEDCYNDNINKNIYTYFAGTHQTQQRKVDWAALNSAFGLLGHNAVDEFWEYKLVLERVDYQYCNTEDRQWHKWDKYWAVCEVNFAVTQQYIMQVSTFGVNPVWTTNEFLKEYYAMDWQRILDKSDLNSVIKTDNSDYAIDSSVQSKFDEFKDKYEKLAVEIDSPSVWSSRSSSIWNILSVNSSDVTIKKVPNKSIYFIEWKRDNQTLTLSQDVAKQLAPAYTIIVENMDVEIVGNVLQYAMIVTNWTMSFKDSWQDGKDNMRCAYWWQVVQWIYVALWWFKAANENLLNQSENDFRCPWWWLHVKWVLIWDWIENISNNKRSQLNSWFNLNGSESVQSRQRREKIIKWASLLIEYNPSLWKTLPPWAEIFTENLEIYRK